MQLRWLVRKGKKATDAEVQKLHLQSGASFPRCREYLDKPDERVLQMLVHMNCPERGLGNYWVDVPIVEEMVDD